MDGNNIYHNRVRACQTALRIIRSEAQIRRLIHAALEGKTILVKRHD
jgi:hypothetical protein